MTAPARHAVRGSRLVSRMRRVGVVAAVAVAASLAALSLPGAARAAPSGAYNQMTGLGPTASAVTVPWTLGILDNNNSPIASADADRDSSSPTSPDAFMYSDFKNLVVTVSQTQDLGHQGITVSWTGGQPTVGSGTVQANFLQMMECWGDAATGPTPEQCEYGSAGLTPSSQDARIGEREGDLCVAGAVPSTSSPPASANGDGSSYGCDPEEPSDPTHIAPCPGTYCAAGTFNIPFSPVSDPTDLDYNPADTTWYSEFTTDEVQEAVTSANGTGQRQFQTLTGVQAPGLGCGEAESDNSPRGCWLVIVPRGTYEPNGYNINPSNLNSFIDTSPLSAANWAQRIQIRLGFAPVGSACPPGTLERQTFGTQLVARAMRSWQLALNQSANCSRIYGYTAAPEATSTQNIEAGGDSGLAFTTIPIGSEAVRDGNPPPTNLPTILYAPVAIAALDFGFNINMGTGYISTPVELTPLLVAKALTQSYKQDLPDYYPDGDAYNQGNPGPAWAAGNPLNISEDPTFEALNPEVPADPSGPIAPLLTEDHSAPNQQVWQWVQASSAATTWLGGTPDASDQNMVVDPDYQALNLGQAPAIDSFPRAYSGVLNLCEPAESSSPPACPAGQKQVQKHSLDLLPYTDSYDSASAAVVSADDPDETVWDETAAAPDGTLGWWDTVGVERPGNIWMWAADDTSDLAAYGLIPASLCNDAGTTCVGPTVASVTAAVNAATPDSSGLLQVNPADPGTGGYPLTQIIYAAVPINQSAAALSDYANLISYAAGAGQTTGTAAGELPPGYLPLPASLQAQALNVVAELRVAAGIATGSEPVTVAVPSTGAFTFTVGTGTVTLTVSRANATGVLIPVTVSDTRNTFPGWSVSGQEAAFAGSGTAAGYTISGNQLGWVPTDTTLGAGATLGPAVTPADPGLGTTAAILAQAPAPNGFGISVLGADLTLAIPGTAAAGPYGGSLTITAVTSLI